MNHPIYSKWRGELEMGKREILEIYVLSSVRSDMFIA